MVVWKGMLGGSGCEHDEQQFGMCGGLGCSVVRDMQQFRMCSGSGVHDDVQWFWMLGSLWFGIHDSLGFSLERRCPNTL